MLVSTAPCTAVRVVAVIRVLLVLSETVTLEASQGLIPRDKYGHSQLSNFCVHQITIFMIWVKDH